MKTTGEVFWIKYSETKVCKKSSCYLWKIIMSYITDGVTCDAGFPKIYSFASIFEEVSPQFQVSLFMYIYCFAQ